jgi:hypothetical protein
MSKSSNVNTTELQRFIDILSHEPLTCTQASIKAGIPQKHCTRRKKDLERSGQLVVLRLVTCPITRFSGVQLLTTNKGLIKQFNRNKPPQLKLFADGQE